MLQYILQCVLSRSTFYFKNILLLVGDCNVNYSARFIRIVQWKYQCICFLDAALQKISDTDFLKFLSSDFYNLEGLMFKEWYKILADMQKAFNKKPVGRLPLRWMLDALEVSSHEIFWGEQCRTEMGCVLFHTRGKAVV